MNSVRIDKWLWAARFFKTRALAARACELGRILCNGIEAKPAREVRAGERTGTFFEILLARPSVLERAHVGDAIVLSGGWCIVHWVHAKRRGVAFYESLALLGVAMHLDGEFLLSLVDTSEERRPRNSRASQTLASLQSRITV